MIRAHFLFCSCTTCFVVVSTISCWCWCSVYDILIISWQGDIATFELLSQSFHRGVITGMDVCIRKPLIATCGLDRSVRIWNYEAWWDFYGKIIHILSHYSVSVCQQLHVMYNLLEIISFQTCNFWCMYAHFRM